MLYHLPKQRVRRHHLDVEYERVGVPVFEVTYREYLDEWFEIIKETYKKPSSFMGLYFNDKALPEHDLPRRFIIINKSMPNYEKLMVLWHEVGHHSCVKAGCLCSRHGFEFRKTELHAEIACIYIATQRRQREITLELLKEATNDLINDGKRSYDYIRNATMMVKHPVWHEAVAMVGNGFDDWLATKPQLRDRYAVALADTSTRMCRWHPTNYLKRYAQAIE